MNSEYADYSRISGAHVSAVCGVDTVRAPANATASAGRAELATADVTPPIRLSARYLLHFRCEGKTPKAPAISSAFSAGFTSLALAATRRGAGFRNLKM